MAVPLFQLLWCLVLVPGGDVGFVQVVAASSDVDNHHHHRHHNLRRLLHPPPHGGGSSSSSGSSGGSSSGGSSSGSHSSGSHSSGSHSSHHSSHSSHSSHHSGPLSTFVQNVKSHGFLAEAAVAATGLTGLLFIVFFVLSAMKRKRDLSKNRLEDGLLNKRRKPTSGFVKMINARLATLSSASTMVDEPSTPTVLIPVGDKNDGLPISGLYASEDTRLKITFTPTVDVSDSSTTNGEMRYKLSGDGYQQCEDSHADAISIRIVDGYSSLDGSIVWWIEERKPFYYDHLAVAVPKKTSMCPRPKCNFKCNTSTGVQEHNDIIPHVFSIDGEQSHVVKVHGKFDFDSNVFHGAWMQHLKKPQHDIEDKYDSLLREEHQGSGKYMLFLQPDDVDEDARTEASSIAQHDQLNLDTIDEFGSDNNKRTKMSPKKYIKDMWSSMKSRIERRQIILED